jgi:SAM-dependent methyltransferase
MESSNTAKKHPVSYLEHPIVWDDEKISRLWDYYSRTPPYSDIYFSKVVGDRVILTSDLPMQALDVIDFGCGPGFMWDHIRTLRPNWRYVGLDFSPDSVAALQTKAHGHAGFGGAHHIKQLPSQVPAASADVVMLIEVVEHLRDEHLNTTLTEAGRLLKAGGVLLITTPNEENLTKSTQHCPECGATYHAWQHVRSWSVRTLEQCLLQHGFELKRAKALDFTERNLTRKMVALGRRLMHGPRPAPHLIAVFQKRLGS